jgi:MoaA/NifB/PqqE/SkfB family radical SAM enzyme
LAHARAIAKSALLFHRQRSALPQTLIYFVTSRCNARCDFCLYIDSVNDPVKQKDELRIDEVERIARRYGPLHYLALSGGEPFIRKDIEPLCQAFIDHCGTSVIDIPSNFYYTGNMLAALEPLVRKNPQTVFEIQFSVDQTGERHDESRKVRGLYRKGVESFRELQKLRERHPNLKLKVNIVFLDCNRGELDRIRAELDREIEYDRIYLTFPHEQLPSRGPAPAETLRDYRDYKRKAEEFVRARGFEKKFDPYTVAMRSVKRTYHRVLEDALSGRRNLGSLCEAGRFVVVMNEKGDVFPCEVLWKPVGNVRESDYDVGSVLRGEAYRKFREDYLGPGKCNCSWSCAALSAISVTPRFLPEIALNSLRTAGSDLLAAAKRSGD